MKSIFQYLNIAALAWALVACQPYFEMVPPTGATGESSEFSDNWYVTLNGSGVKNGSDWNNALPFADFLQMIANPSSSLSESGIHIQEGVYPATKKDAINIISKDILCIRGGYSADLLYDDLSDCDSELYPTVFTGDVDGDGNGDGAFALVTNGNVRFENITFNKFIQNATISDLSGVGGKGTAVFAINGPYLTTSVECLNCIFDSNENAINNSAGKEGGACAFISQGYFKARDCSFINNKGNSRGGALRVNSTTSVIFLDRCYFGGNSLTGGSFGSAIQCSSGVVCMNNTTMVGNTGTGSTLNGGGGFFIANSTVIDDSEPNGTNNAAFRCESKSEADATIINSILLNSKSSGQGLILNNKAVLKSKGYNVFQTMNIVAGSTEPTTKQDLKVTTPLKGKDRGDCWEWDFSQIATDFGEFAIGDDIYDAAVAFNPVSYCSISVLGRAYANWVTPVSFSVDGRGVPRGEDGFQPGAYDVNLD